MPALLIPKGFAQPKPLAFLQCRPKMELFMTFYRFVKSCKDSEINPWEYFDDMLRRIMSHPVTRLRELLPDQWKPRPKTNAA